MVVAIAAGAMAVGTAASAYSASRQAGAARDAAQMQQQSADQAIQLQRDMYQQQRRDVQPWRQAGMAALGRYQQLAAQGPPAYQDFQAPAALDPSQYAFQAPTAADMPQDPGYQFRLQQGQQALERSAAARGGLFSGGFGRDLTDYAQGLASQEYGNVYNRALGANQLRYGRDLAANQSGYERALQQFTMNYEGRVGDWRNRLAPWQLLAGGGQQAGGQLAGFAGTHASQIGSILQANANAQGAAQLAQANAWGNVAGQTANNLGFLGSMYAGQQRQVPPAAMTVNPYQRSIYNPYS